MTITRFETPSRNRPAHHSERQTRADTSITSYKNMRTAHPQREILIHKRKPEHKQRQNLEGKPTISRRISERRRCVQRIESEVYSDSTTGLLKPLARKSRIQHLEGKPMSPIGQARKKRSKADRNRDTHSPSTTRNPDLPEQGPRRFDNRPN